MSGSKETRRQVSDFIVGAAKRINWTKANPDVIWEFNPATNQMVRKNMAVFVDDSSSNEPEEEASSTEQGLRYNEGKLPFHLIPPEVEVALAAALLYGAQKYAPRNWEKGLSWSETYASLRRHLNAWYSGEEFDYESDLPHLYLALANIAFLLTFEERGVGTDDRA